MVEANPVGDSNVGTNNQSTIVNSDKFVINNYNNVNIEVVPSTRETKAPGVPRKNTTKDKDKR